TEGMRRTYTRPRRKRGTQSLSVAPDTRAPAATSVRGQLSRTTPAEFKVSRIRRTARRPHHVVGNGCAQRLEKLLEHGLCMLPADWLRNADDGQYRQWQLPKRAMQLGVANVSADAALLQAVHQQLR